MNLYLITILSYDQFYVVAENTNKAYQKLLNCLEDKDLYFFSERKLKTIELIAENFYEKDLFEKVN